MQFTDFGFKENPFSITPDPHYLYLSEGHEESLAHLLYGAGPNGGFVQLTGEVGTGKTLLVRALLERHPEDVEIAYIYNPLLSRRELLATICDELQVPIGQSAYAVKRLLDLLVKHLLATHAAGRRTVLIIDEAQNLNPKVLETVRLLTNLETSQHKLLRIILVGQPELQQLLSKEGMRQVAQRITARYHLKPLKCRETGSYIRHRLSVAGASETLFSRFAIWLVYTLSGGVPRIINAICERSLLALFAMGQDRVGPTLVWRAAKEVMPPRLKWRFNAIVAAAMVLLLLLPLGVMLRSKPLAEPQNQMMAAEPNQLQADEMVPTKQNSPEPNPIAVEVDRLKQRILASAYSRKQIHQDLLALWNERTEIYSKERYPCKVIESIGFRCMDGSVSMDELLKLNRPAILTLELDEKSYQLLLTAVDGDHLTVNFGDGPEPVERGELEALWQGDYLLLWRPQMEIPLVGPGSAGDSVRWVQQRLAMAEGSTIEEGASRSYNPQLKQRIKRYQRRIGQVPDGIVGQKTMLYLNNLHLAAGTPTLKRRGGL